MKNLAANVRLFRSTFWIALGVILVVALLPTASEPKFVAWQDKIEHFAVFFGLALLGALAAFGRTHIVIGLACYGALMELAQSLTPHRMGDIRDWIADVLGVALATLISALWLSARRTNR